MRCLIISLLALSVSFYASISSALVIDDFTFGQSGLSANDSSPDVSGFGFAPPANIIGFERDVRLMRTSTGLPSTLAFFATPYPFVQIVPGNSTNVVVTLQYDGIDSGSNVLNPVGLSPLANLIGPGSNLISVTVNNGPVATPATFTIRDSANVVTTNSLVIPSNFSGDLQFLFADFDTPANFSQVEAMQLQLTVAQGTTFNISGVLQSEYIFFGIPEPSTISLLLPMLGGIVWRRRRHKALAKSI